MLKALVVVRLSRVTDATSSPERQREICQTLCRERGYEVAGVAEDLDVSGAVDPFDRRKRPNLAGWLHNRHNEFDVIVSYRVDRFTRSVRHLQQLVAWAEDHDKIVVSATEPHFDMSTPFAAVVIALMGTVAQMELEAISERNASAKRRDIRLGKYRGGTPPWGYKPERDGDGVWRLVRDDKQARIIHEVVRRVIDGDPIQRIAHDLTRRGIPTPKDRALQLQGKPMKGTAWSTTPLKRSLLSEAMLGRVTDASGKALRADDGSPINMPGVTRPILTREEFDEVTTELARRAKTGDPTKRKTALLLKVLYCGKCGQPFYRFNGGSHSQFPRYRCKSLTSAAKCGNGTIKLPDADNYVERAVLGLLGESEHRERVWDAGSENASELAEIDQTLIDLTGLLGSGAYRAGTPQRAKLNERINELAARQAALSAKTARPAGWTWQPTGEKFSAWWARQETTDRNIWLRSANVRLEFDQGRLRLDLGDLETLLGHMTPGGASVSAQQMFAAMQAEGIAGAEIFGDEVEFVSVAGQRVRFPLIPDRG